MSDGVSKRLDDGLTAMGSGIEHALVGVFGAGGYQILGLAFFAAMAALLWRTARRRQA